MVKDKQQHIVLQALKFKKADLPDINKFFKERKWGKVKYVMTITTLAGQGGAGGRTDVVFKYIATTAEVLRFSIQRFKLGSPPRWLEDYIDNNKDIISGKDRVKLEKLRAW